MEFKVTTDLAVFKQPILFNVEELKSELAERLEHYNTRIVTEDAIRDAKSDRATLNQLRTAMENKRKEIKAQCAEPYTMFKTQYDQVLALIDAPIAAIDRQTKVFDDKRREEKLAEITALWNENVGNHADYIAFKQVFKTKWLNATYKISDITNEMMSAFLKVEDDLKAIRALSSDFELEALSEYTTSNSLNAALSKIRALENLRKAEQARPDATKPQAPQQEQTIEQPARAPVNRQASPIVMVDFRVHATREQLSALKAFLSQNHIQYGKVPQEG